MVHGHARIAHRGRLLSTQSELGDWLASALGHRPAELAAFQQALTHGSHGGNHYQRLEFLGDRILGLVMAEWLFELYPDEPEGHLSKRLNAQVSGESCAGIARALGVPTHLRLGKQARDDGGSSSTNILGDVMEALIGAIYLDAGLDAARGLIRRLWSDQVTGTAAVPQHPKSALQEWAAAHRRRTPHYEIVERSGPDHAPVFMVEVTVNGAGSAQGSGSSKQEAETAAATALLAELK